MTNFINEHHSKAGMITITFPDGKEKEFDIGITVLEIAKSIGPRLFDAALAAKVDGKLVDLGVKIEKNARVQIITFNDKEGKDVFRHSSAHVLAHAVHRLFPDANPTIGPVVDEGFFYDFEFRPFTPEDLAKLEEEMQKIVKENISVERIEYKTKEDAKKVFKENTFKCELIETAEEGLSAYKQGDFIDLCRGPHVPNTGKIKAFKLTKVASAYWRGDAKNKQLSRIYGISFPEKKLLDEHLHMLEEAEKRDHRRLGKELGLFMTHEMSPGSPFYLPKGAILYNALIQFLRTEYFKRGYVEVVTPLLYDKALWVTSGHWEHYQENMFFTESEGRTFSLKPMNCPSHCLIYKNSAKSYRDLPLRIADFAPLHRNELSGTLSGLTRVRKFSQDDGHIFCTIESLQGELQSLLSFVKYIYNDIFKMQYTIELSTRPEKYLGELSVWNSAEETLAQTLTSLGITFKINPGDGAFYGPKIDIHVKDAIGRTWQCATIQLDFQLPKRFELEYEGNDGKKHTPVIIHRAIFGSLERFIGVLIEHFAGKFPLWLSPEQIRILPIADRHNAYALQVKEELQKEGLRVSVDEMAETTPKKVRQAQLDQVNYILVVGDKEVENKTINVRTRDNIVHGEKKVDIFTKELLQEIKDKKM